ncbi:MAG: dihydroorotase [Cyclobacteriaceae bacterium]|nr:dihydroorotase [Cyclobacteriaceae bacterium]
MSRILFKNGKIINRGQISELDILVSGRIIERIDRDISAENVSVTEAGGQWILPGIIDDQVHFREPGLTHKGDIFTESRAAVAGGVTSYMEMPNTKPAAVTRELLEEKYNLAAQKSLANYSFYMGAANDNLEEVLSTDGRNVCGIKIFMGSSTGNMLVDNRKTLESIFSGTSLLIATHCEDENTVRENSEKARKIYGENVPIALHPEIRSEEACYLSSSLAVALAEKYGSRLHVLHISTARELDLFRNQTPLDQKKVTAEACIHHLWFTGDDYARHGSLIKWNPAVKNKTDREALREAVTDGHIDVIATDHAPHTLEEKRNTYFKAPSGGPLVQHSLVAMLELCHQGLFPLELIVEKMAHNPAILFGIERRGFLEEGNYADIVIVDPDFPWTVGRENILAKCGWSPFENQTFRSRISKTYVSGNLVYDKGGIIESGPGMRLLFSRNLS